MEPFMYMMMIEKTKTYMQNGAIGNGWICNI